MALMLTVGCGRESAGRGSSSGHGHVHVAPHGGTAVILGNEIYHLELVRDPAAGKLQAYVMDGHLADFIRIPAGSFEIAARFGGREEILTFKPVANPATGETVGNTSLFEAGADWLKTNADFDGVLRELTIRGSRFENVEFNFPKGNEATGK